MIDTTGDNKRKLRPFDAASHDDFSMYNKLPYYRDINLCTEDTITLVTGNVIKYFQYQLLETLPLHDMDQIAVIKIRQYMEREQKRKDQLGVAAPNSSQNEETSEEELTVQKVDEAPKKRPAYLDLDFD
ncbi:MAG: hypothetical protein PWP24_819 [Clostridiales bacterium]|nr:hypothetical protein [Clostridiales bacterium]